MYHSIGIQTIHNESIRSKVKRLVSSVKAVIETRKSSRVKQIEKEQKISAQLNQLFEVTQNEALLSFEKREFLLDQRTVREKLVSNFHLRFISRNLPSTSNQIQQSMMSSLPSTSNQSRSNANEIANAFDSENDESDDSASTMDFDDSPDFVPSGRDVTIKTPLNHDEIQNLSKCGGSYRTMEKVLSIGIKAAGGDPNQFSISKAALWGQLSKFRASEKSAIQEKISSSNEKVLIHFDEKDMPKINQKHIGKDSRLVVVSHTQTNDFALGLPILESKTADSITNEIVGLCENHDLLNRVIGIVCDTTSTNTGENTGVCVRFQDELERDLLNILCRHHVYEVHLSRAFRSTFGQIEATTVTIFDQLKLEWPQIKEYGYRYRPCDPEMLNLRRLRALYHDARDTLTAHSKSKFIRDDYAELNDLCLKFLGIETEKQFMVPGSVSKARWMAKGLYAIKMYLFRDQLDLDEEFEAGLLEFSLFVVLVYTKFWNRSSVAVDAAVNDLSMLKDLEKFAYHNEPLANAVFESFQNHLWYLGEELVVMSIFSDKVSAKDKNRMRLQLLADDLPDRNENSIRLKDYNENMELPELVTARSRFLFSILDIDLSFCAKTAEIWNRDASYKRAKKLIEELIVVVNDSAERALGRADTIIKNQKARSELRFQEMFLSSFS